MMVLIHLPQTRFGQLAKRMETLIEGRLLYKDVVGVSGFDTKKWSLTSIPLPSDTYTNYQPGGIGSWGVADSAINATSASTNYNTYTTGYFGSISSKFEYGIDMQAYYRKDQSANNVTLKNVATWATTFSFVNPPGWIYLRWGI